MFLVSRGRMRLNHFDRPDGRSHFSGRLPSADILRRNVRQAVVAGALAGARRNDREREGREDGGAVRRPAAFSQVWWQEWGLSAMLVFLVLALFVALPLEALGIISSTVVGIALTFLFVAGVVAMAGRGPVTVVVAVGGPRVARRALAVPDVSRGRDLEVLDIVLAMVALALLTAFLLRHVFREGPITADRIRGAIAVYLLIGVLWCLAYQLLEYVAPGSFHFAETGPAARAPQPPTRLLQLRHADDRRLRRHHPGPSRRPLARRCRGSRRPALSGDPDRPARVAPDLARQGGGSK